MFDLTTGRTAGEANGMHEPPASAWNTIPATAPRQTEEHNPMELREAVQRILSHSGLIFIMVLLALLIPVISYFGKEDIFEASARLSIGPDTTNSSQAEALVDTAKGIITSPGQVTAAVGQLSVYRDPDKVAEKQIDVESVGSSGVLILSVTDTDPGVAAQLANTLADQLLATRRQQIIEPLEQRLAGVDLELAIVEEDIQAIESEAASQASVDALRLRLDEALRRRTELWTQRQDINDALVAAPKAVLLDPATVPSDAEPTRLVADLAVAGLLGLILGIALATLRETLRPSIPNSHALSRVLGAPVLGHISYPLEPDADVGDQWLLRNLGLAAKGARVDVVQLVSVGPDIDLRQLAAQIRLSSGQLRFSSTAAAAVPLRGLLVNVVSTNGDDSPRPRELSLAEGHRSGLVVVAPEVLARDELSDLEHLLAITDWPLLGIISYLYTGVSRAPDATEVVDVHVDVELIPAPEPSAEPWS